MILIRRIVGTSMLPALRPGSIVIGWRKPRRFNDGDVVIFNHRGREKIKRIAEIKGDQVFVLGDNRAQSTDSREFGYVDRSDMSAKVIWPRMATSSR